MQNDYEKDILDEKLTRAFGEIHAQIKVPDADRFEEQFLLNLKNKPVEKKSGYHRYLLAAIIPLVILPVVYTLHKDKTENKKEIAFHDSSKKESAEPAYTKPVDEANRTTAGRKKEAVSTIQEREYQKSTLGATAREEMNAMVPEIPPTAMSALEDEKAEAELLKKLSLSKSKPERLEVLKKLETLYTKIGESKKLKSVQNEISSME